MDDRVSVFCTKLRKNGVPLHVNYRGFMVGWLGVVNQRSRIYISWGGFHMGWCWFHIGWGRFHIGGGWLHIGSGRFLIGWGI